MKSNIKLVILDDDPTGIQTVKGCKLITCWDEDTVRKALNDEVPFFYILTNTRAMTREDAARVTREAMEAVLKVQGAECKVHFISRSDSCLRGHFPLETDVIRQVLKEHGIKVWDKTPFIPAFIEAGRVTIDGVHYMKVQSRETRDERLIPVSETEFARDNVFGYSTSVLCDYIMEKGANPDDYEIVDAQSYDELNAYCEQLLEQTADFDGSVVIRSSSSLPKAMSDHLRFSNLQFTTDDTNPAENGIPIVDSKWENSKLPGLFVVGSHVKKTTEQLTELLRCPGVRGMEIDVEKILNDDAGYMDEIVGDLANGQQPTTNPQPPTTTTFVLYTSRKEIRIDDADKRQHLGQQISDFLVDIVRHLPFIPSYLVAKGGITSNDILTKGLGIKIATVMGQVIKNVPCVMTEHFPYIIFPGNVGDKDSLAELYMKLQNNK